MESCNGEISVGPFGGPGGKDFTYRAKKAIKQIVVIHNDNVIESILFKDDSGGNSSNSGYSGTFGGGFHAGIRTDTIDIDFPSDYLTGVSGTYSCKGSMFVKSIKFYTKCKEYGPFGDGCGTPFSFRQEGGLITGFHGRVDKCIHSIGFYLKPLSAAFMDPIEKSKLLPSRVGKEIVNSDELVVYKNRQVREYMIGVSVFSICVRSVKEDLTTIPRKDIVKKKQNRACCEGEISIIPWGGLEGDKWTGYKPKGGVGTIVISYGEVIHSIRFIEHGSNESSPIFGGHGGYKTAVINIKNPSEYLAGIHGYQGYHLFYANNSPTRVIKSLSFETNVRKYGPFGVERGIYFSCSMEGGKIVGFHGLAGKYLTAIGVYAKRVCSCSKRVDDSVLTHEFLRDV